MSTILVLNSSLSGATSVSDRLVEEAVAQLSRLHPAAKVVRRDLAPVGSEGMKADPSVEVLDPQTGARRWDAVISATDARVSEAT